MQRPFGCGAVRIVSNGRFHCRSVGLLGVTRQAQAQARRHGRREGVRFHRRRAKQRHVALAWNGVARAQTRLSLVRRVAEKRIVSTARAQLSFVGHQKRAHGLVEQDRDRRRFAFTRRNRDLQAQMRDQRLQWDRARVRGRRSNRAAQAQRGRRQSHFVAPG